MARQSDNEIIRDAIEVFLVQHFDSIELAGRVAYEKKTDVNYFGIDLNEVNWDQDVEKLHAELSKYLLAWIRKNHSIFKDYTSLSHLTIEYFLAKKDGSSQNQAKSIVLFHLPDYYYQSNLENDERVIRNKIIICMLTVWNNYFLRNAVIVALFVILCFIVSFASLRHSCQYQQNMAKAFDYINIASSIIGSLILGFIINKVITIRQEKLKRVNEIKKLSNQLTYFRKICFNFIRDHQFWNKDNRYISSFNHANSIKHLISYEDFYYPTYDNKAAYAKYRSITNDQESYPVIQLVLQLYMFADDEYLHSGLTYTEYPRNYIYSFQEMEFFISFSDANHIWYCCQEGDYFPDIFPNGYYSKEILKDTKRIDEKYDTRSFTKKLLSKVSLDFQYDIIPRLYYLTKLNEARLPLSIFYFQITFSMILSFGIIIPSILYIFVSNKIYAFLNVYVIIGIILHVLLSLPYLLKDENELNKENDYQ